ncbi:multiple epidermal growth factor-like domains protein 10 [Saccostrea echinata]|uniref:multiple epidermal growth factor-like domains protein 10 n=1 Tax=Saccostrea echinata TaxID=191078 RepID=UPI002A81F425|nr:multiple epidermal growth factor-like domains protein 10 [Saccostrea echinata]
MFSFTELCEVIVLGLTRRVERESNPGPPSRLIDSCDIGKFGLNCVFNCSGHCKGNVPCNTETGHCDTGCNVGYKGKFCRDACSFGRFGNGCVNICSRNCHYNETCSHINGICSKGCAPGYFGSLCSKVCPVGSYGLNCSGTCSRNCIGTCGNTDGSCKCAPGFTDSPNCTMKCFPGFYGINCQYRCSGQCVNDETCSRYDGSCSQGCKENYVGVACAFLQETSASTVGLPIVVAVYSLCLMAAFIFFYLRPQFCISKFAKPKFAPEDMKSGQSSSPKTSNSDDDTHNYQDLDAIDDKNSYELMQASENLCAYQNLELTI